MQFYRELACLAAMVGLWPGTHPFDHYVSTKLIPLWAWVIILWVVLSDERWSSRIWRMCIAAQ